MLHRIRFLLPVFTLIMSLFTFQTSQAATFKLPDTGQAKCYQAVDPYGEIPCAGTGQDGAYRINLMSFTDNGDGTVTDNNTGLVWQKCSMGQNNDASCSGTALEYNWYQASGTYDATYNASNQNVCGSLTLDVGGWRLPSKKELLSIVYYSIPFSGPTIHQTMFPNTISSYYWSSTTFAYPSGAMANNAWYVSFNDGHAGNFNKFSSYYDVLNKIYSYHDVYVRCVRGGQ